MPKLTEAQRADKLASFLDALDDWDLENDARAHAIIQFIDGGYDLSEYEDWTGLRVIEGGRSDA